MFLQPLGLERLNLLCLQSLRTLLDDELYGLSFLQAAEAIRLDGREMNENVFATLAADETIALRVIEPLHSSLFHTCCKSFW